MTKNLLFTFGKASFGYLKNYAQSAAITTYALAPKWASLIGTVSGVSLCVLFADGISLVKKTSPLNLVTWYENGNENSGGAFGDEIKYVTINNKTPSIGKGVTQPNIYQKTIKDYARNFYDQMADLAQENSFFYNHIVGRIAPLFCTTVAGTLLLLSETIVSVAEPIFTVKKMSSNKESKLAIASCLYRTLYGVFNCLVFVTAEMFLIGKVVHCFISANPHKVLESMKFAPTALAKFDDTRPTDKANENNNNPFEMGNRAYDSASQSSNKNDKATNQANENNNNPFTMKAGAYDD